jgi:hypothetical protein
MKNKLIVIITMLFLSISVMANKTLVRKYQITYNKSDFSIEQIEGITHISAKDVLWTYLNGDPKEPALPFLSVNILIGKNELFEDVNYTAIEENLLSNVIISPNQAEIPTDRMPDKYSLSEIRYKKDTYPSRQVIYSGTFYCHGYQYVSLLLCPFRYDNSKKRLYIGSSFSINLSVTREKPIQSSNTTARKSTMDDVRRLVINSDELEALYPKSKSVNNNPVRSGSVSYSYAIVTNNALKSTFQKLANWKTYKGVRATVLTVEYINTHYTGNTLQQKIKKALKSLYENNLDFKYALLGGDVDIVPTEKCFIKY